MFNTISLLWSFKPLVWECLCSPFQTKRLINFCKQLSIVFKQNNKNDAILDTIELLAELKRSNYDDYTKLFYIIHEIIDTYKNNPDSIRKKIKEFMD